MEKDPKYMYLESIKKRVSLHAKKGYCSWRIGDETFRITAGIERMLVYALYAYANSLLNTSSRSLKDVAVKKHQKSLQVSIVCCNFAPSFYHTAQVTKTVSVDVFDSDEK